jgi:hypothetical protein
MYLFSIIALMSLVLLKQVTKQSPSANIDLISLFILIFISAFSYHNGWDSHNYQGYFEQILEGGWDIVIIYSAFGLEFGYLTFLYAISLFTSEYQVVVVFQSLFLNLILFLAVRRLKFNYTLFALLFFSSFFIKFELSTIRQGLAVAIVVLSYKYLVAYNLKKFITIVIFASLFHYSALIMLIFYFFNKIDLSRKMAIKIAFLALPAFFLALILKNLTYDLLVNTSLSSFPVTNKLITYFGKSNNQTLPLIQLYSLLLYLYFCIFLYDDKDGRSKLVLSLFSFLILIQFYFKMLPSLLLVRLEYYFILSQLFVWLLLLERLIMTNKIMNVVCLVVILPILNFSIALRNPYDRQVYFPYYSFIEYVFFDKQSRRESEVKKIASEYK